MSNHPFSELNLSPAIATAVAEMGFTSATPIQAEAIPVIRTGADVLARSQTGTGKTVAFGIPAVECVDPQASCVQVLVLSPTRELAHQCGDEIRKLAKHLSHVKTADILGGGDYRGQFKNLQNANIVIGTPGRIMDHIRRGSLQLGQLKMVVLDEADEMLNMGFREDIEFILEGAPEERQIVLFSATVPDAILAIAAQFQTDPVHIAINREQVTLDQIQQFSVDVPMRQKKDALKLLLHYYQPTRSMIFANTKSMVDELTELLAEAGFSVEGLHGDMKQLQRTNVMNGFKKGRISILVATDVAARGIDVSDIDYVFNFDIPKETEYYVHRIGRTGRAGRSGTAITLHCGRQQMYQLKRLAKVTKSDIAELALPTADDVRQKAQTRFVDSLAQQLSAAPQEQYSQMVAQLVEQGHDAQTIAAVLLENSFGKTLEQLNTLPTVSSKMSPRRDRPEPFVSHARDNRSEALLVIDTGWEDRITKSHIVGAIAKHTGIKASDLGKIQISEAFTMVAVPEELRDKMMHSLHGCTICGKAVDVFPMEGQIPPRKPAKARPAHNRGDRNHRNAPGRGARPYKKHSGQHQAHQ